MGGNTVAFLVATWWQTHPQEPEAAALATLKTLRFLGSCSLCKVLDTTLYRKVQRYRLENVGLTADAAQSDPPRVAPPVR